MVHTWRSEDNHRRQSSPSALFETGSLLFAAPVHRLAGPQVGGSLSLFLILALQHCVTVGHDHTELCMSLGDLKSGTQHLHNKPFSEPSSQLRGICKQHK